MTRDSLGGPLMWTASHTPGATHSRSSATDRIEYSWPSSRLRATSPCVAATIRELSPGTVRSCTVSRYWRPTLPGVKAAGSHDTTTWGPLLKAGSPCSEAWPGAAAAPAGRASAIAMIRANRGR